MQQAFSCKMFTVIARQYGYHAEVYADVIYDGAELGRFTFQVRKLPTLVIGGIADQLGQPLSGVSVSLPALGRTTTTNQVCYPYLIHFCFL
jgi:hypothetical protein